jgi:prolyl oligopeptidase
LQGEERPQVNFPLEGTVRWLHDLGDGSSLFLSCESFTQPPEIFEYIPASGALTVWYERPSSQAFTSVKVRRTTYTSLDETEIPITLVGRHPPSDAESAIPVIMTSYGGFGVPMTPQFSVLVTLLLECGTLFALPHIRGGGDFGKMWHDAGRKRGRQKSIDDFVAAADWLCREGVTTPLQLGMFGGSNSGLLVAAAMTQRPDLFRAVLCIAPLLDMVRYEHFDEAAKWSDEYGTCQNREDFLALLSYSPYHQVRDDLGYPSVLFVSGDKDDRCNPAHARKMAARLLENREQAATVLLDYSGERGHSPVLPLNVRIDALARRMAFLCRELNLSFSDGGVHEASRD